MIENLSNDVVIVLWKKVGKVDGVCMVMCCMGVIYIIFDFEGCWGLILMIVVD